jgi:hypothetical protein
MVVASVGLNALGAVRIRSKEARRKYETPMDVRDLTAARRDRLIVG